MVKHTFVFKFVFFFLFFYTSLRGVIRAASDPVCRMTVAVLIIVCFLPSLLLQSHAAEKKEETFCRRGPVGQEKSPRQVGDSFVQDLVDFFFSHPFFLFLSVFLLL